MSVSNLLSLSALGIYAHSIFITITLGFPIVIMALLYRYSKTGEEFYMGAAKKMTAVLAVNFGLGAVTGTLVEFGLVQAWPGTIIAIASFIFAPLALELIAFAWEIATLILFIVTLGKIKPLKSLAILLVYWIFAFTSGILIVSANSWLVVPWGTGNVPAAIYPFMPEFGEVVFDAKKLLILKIILLASGQPLHAILQSPESVKLGSILSDPFVAFNNPYNIWSNVHNLTAAFIVGMSIATAGWMFAYSRSKNEKYVKIVKSYFPILLALLIIQPTIFGHFMGEQVVENNPTKFAMMENALTTYNNPVVALLAYGDPEHPIVGFDRFETECRNHGDQTLGDLAQKLGISREDVMDTAETVGVSLNPTKLDGVLNTKLNDVCLQDLNEAEKRVPLVHAAYYAKLTAGVIAFLSVIAMASALYSIPVLSQITNAIIGKRYFLLSLLVAIGSVFSAALGWAVREVGRKPWTVYGLLKPEELVNVNSIVVSPAFIAFMAVVVVIIAAGGVAAMIIVAKRFGVVE